MPFRRAAGWAVFGAVAKEQGCSRTSIHASACGQSLEGHAKRIMKEKGCGKKSSGKQVVCTLVF